MQAAEPASECARVTRALKIVLLFLIVAVALAVFEWLYHPGVTLARRTAGGTLLGALTAKALLFLAPTLLVALGLVGARWPRTAWAVALSGTTVTVLWLVVDLRVRQWTGARALDYLAFVLERPSLEWAGGQGGLLGPILGVAVPAVLLVLLSAWGAARMVDRLLAMITPNGAGATPVAVQADAPKTDAPKTDAPKVDAPKTDTSKTETTPTAAPSPAP